MQISFTLLVTFAYFFIYTKASNENVFPSFTYFEFYILPVVWLLVFQMDYWLLHMRERFAFVNNHFESFLHKNKRVSMLNVLFLNKLNYVHFILYEISTEINNVYSFQLLIIIPRIIFFCVLPVHYNILTSLVKDPNESNSPQIWTHIFTLSQIILLIAPIIYVVNVASNILDQVRNFLK